MPDIVLEQSRLINVTLTVAGDIEVTVQQPIPEPPKTGSLYSRQWSSELSKFVWAVSSGGGGGADIYVSSAALNGNVLELTRSDSAILSVDLSTLLIADDFVTSAALVGTELQLNRDQGGLVTVDLATLQAIDADAPDANNYVRTSGTWVDLSSFGFLTEINSADVINALGYVPQNNATAFDGNYSSLNGIPSTFTPASHNHAIADVTSLQNELDGKKEYFGIESLGALSFDDTTHVLTIAGGNNVYWIDGVKAETTSHITCDIDSFETLTTNTLYWFYFDDTSLTLKCSDTAVSFADNAVVATVFWNGSIGAVHKETHAFDRDRKWQTWAHHTIGTLYESGLTLTNPTTVNDALLQIEPGQIRDEDIIIPIAQQTTMRGIYKVNATTFTFANYSLPYLGTSGQPQYLNTNTYTLTNVANNNYACYWVYGSNDIERPIYVCPTHASSAFSTIASAEAATPPVLAGFNLNPELRLLYKLVYRGNGELQESVDYRSSSSVPIGGVGNIVASSVSFLPTGTVTSTNVQAAIAELDSDIQNITASIPGPKTISTANYTVLAADHLGTIYFTYNGTVIVDFDDTLAEPFQVDLVVDSASTTITTIASGTRTIQGALSITGLDSALSVRLNGSKYYALGGGEANIGENLGAGEGLYTANNNGALQFKTLIAGSGIQFVVSGESITILSTGGAEFTYPAVLNTYFTNTSITNSIYKDQLYDLYLFLTGATDSGARSGANWTQLSSNLWTQTLGLWISHSNYNATSGLIYDLSANAKNLTPFGSITRTGGLWTYSTGGGYISADSVIPDKASGSYSAYIIADFTNQQANTGSLGVYRNPGTGRATLLSFTASDDFATVFHNNGTSYFIQYNVGDLNQVSNQGLGVIDCGANSLIYYANGSTVAANTVAVAGGVNLTGTHWLCIGANNSSSIPPTAPVVQSGTGVGQMPIAIIFNTNPSAENAKIKAAINSIFGWTY